MMADDKEQFAVSSESEPADSEEEPDSDDNAGKPPVPREKLEPSAKMARPGKAGAGAKVPKGGSAYARASDAAHQIMGRSDWLVEHLTPRLREFIWARFQEAGLERGV